MVFACVFRGCCVSGHHRGRCFSLLLMAAGQLFQWTWQRLTQRHSRSGFCRQKDWTGLISTDKRVSQYQWHCPRRKTPWASHVVVLFVFFNLTIMQIAYCPFKYIESSRWTFPSSFTELKPQTKAAVMYCTLTSPSSSPSVPLTASPAVPPGTPRVKTVLAQVFLGCQQQPRHLPQPPSGCEITLSWRDYFFMALLSCSSAANSGFAGSHNNFWWILL